MKNDKEFRVCVSPERLTLDTTTAALGATVHLLAGLQPSGAFNSVRQPLIVDETEPNRCYCPVERGIYLIRAGGKALAVLMPEKVQVTVKAAMELLRLKALPPPQTLRDEVIVEINTSLARGESWAAVSARIGIGQSGNGIHADKIDQKKEEYE